MNKVLRWFGNSNNVKLGRREHRLNNEQKDLKAIWANSDHCGDVLCKDPKVVKGLIDSQKQKTSTEEMDEYYVSQLLNNELNNKKV